MKKPSVWYVFTLGLLFASLSGTGFAADRQTEVQLPELSVFADKAEAELRQNILPFWMKHACDRERGGFVGALGEDLKPVNPEPPRGPLLGSRILWTFSAAYRRYRDPAYLEMAEHAYQDLDKSYWDSEYGGYVWMIDAKGQVVDSRKQVYGHSFAIYGLSEYHMASGLEAPLKRAIEVYRLVEKYSRDRDNGGYLEAFTREWKRPRWMSLSAIGPDHPKSQNTHLHLMEAYTSLYKAWPDAGLRDDLRALIELMLTRIITPDGKHLSLYFSKDWTPATKRFSYGHDIEANWLMTQAAEALGDKALLARVHKAVLRLADATLAEGMDKDGGIWNEGTAKGVDDRGKEWWQQAEAVVGFLNSYQISGDSRYLAAAWKTWTFIEQSISDKQDGEWRRAVTPDGRPIPGLQKVAYWKCPYHNGRACLETSSRLRSLMKNP